MLTKKPYVDPYLIRKVQHDACDLSVYKHEAYPGLFKAFTRMGIVFDSHKERKYFCLLNLKVTIRHVGEEVEYKFFYHNRLIYEY